MRLIREEKTFIREAVLLMLPMILQNFVTFSMSMADTFMVGVLGETALAAVTMANSPFYVMQLMIFGVQSGMSVLVAQYHGRGDQEAINRVMGIALFVSTTITACSPSRRSASRSRSCACSPTTPTSSRPVRRTRATSAFRISSPPSAACTSPPSAARKIPASARRCSPCPAC